MVPKSRLTVSRLRLLRLPAAFLLVVGVIHVAFPPLACPPPDPTALDRLQGEAPAVQLWLAPIWFLDGRAVHPHFLYTRTRDSTVHRVEVWQDARGPLGHLFVDELPALLTQRRGLCLAGTRTGDAALEVIEVIERAPETYVWRDTYAYWPGPNSNTFGASVLDAAGWTVDLPRQAIGQRFGLPFVPTWTAPRDLPPAGGVDE